MSGIVFEDIGGVPVAQDGDGLLVTTDACLLSAFVRRNGKQRICELCAGDGIVSAMILAHGKAASCVCVDFQAPLCRLAEKNAVPFDGKMSVVRSDVLDYRPERVFDAVVCNPPYFVKSAKPADNAVRDLSRRESTATVSDFAACASRILRDGGDAYFCYDPARLVDLLCACRENRLEPKTLVNVYPDSGHRSNLLLLAAKKNGSLGLNVARPLLLNEQYEKIIKNNTIEFLYE